MDLHIQISKNDSAYFATHAKTKAENKGVKSSFLTHYVQSAIRIQTIFSRWGTQISNKGSKMARALRITFPGAFYHVTSRGNERKAVFKSIRDREKFLEYLDSATQRYDALIHA
jgi:hypothetical protein